MAGDLADLSAFLAARGRDLGDSAPADLEAWFADIGARGLAPATAARRRSAARQFHRFAVAEGWRPDDPSSGIDAPKQGRPLPKILTRDEGVPADRRRPGRRTMRRARAWRR